MIVRGLQVVLETFSDYPLDTQSALAKYSYLETIEPGRVIMKKVWGLQFSNFEPNILIFAVFVTYYDK